MTSIVNISSNDHTFLYKISAAGYQEKLQINLRELVKFLRQVPEKYKLQAEEILDSYPKACSAQLGIDLATFNTFIKDDPYNCTITPIKSLKELQNHTEDSRVILPHNKIHLLLYIFTYYLNNSQNNLLPRMQFSE
jgi:hypothetical protein